MKIKIETDTKSVCFFVVYDNKCVVYIVKLAKRCKNIKNFLKFCKISIAFSKSLAYNTTTKVKHLKSQYLYLGAQLVYPSP